MILLKDLRDELKWMRSKFFELEEQQKQFPLYKLKKTRNDGKVVYYKVYHVAGKRKRKVVRYGEKDYFDVLKGICIDAKFKMVGQNLKLLERIEPQFRNIEAAELISVVSELNPKLDVKDIAMAVREIENIKDEPSPWALADYKMSDYLEDEKIHTTSRGLKVRSKSELIICEIFYKYGIEFRYEEVIYLNGKRLVPDFVIRRKSDGKIFYWEHCGMMDQPIYRKRYFEKRDLYEFCGIVPWDNLIFTYDMDGSIDSNYIDAIVKAVLLA
ncbi:MAG: hypothetical protein J6Q41_08640 [Firmicutes bacterium]|nr:hypothetical protein [Bacillota bacterium]